MTASARPGADRTARSPLIDALDLAPHPEGGWFRRTWQVPYAVDLLDGRRRPPATSILYLLQAGEASSWHRVASDELWLAHRGVVTLELGATGDEPRLDQRLVIGTDPLEGQLPQFAVPAGTWQRTLPVGSDTLVSCVVSPGFDFADFVLHEPPDRLGSGHGRARLRK